MRHMGGPRCASTNDCCHYLRHAACSPRPPALSVLCVRDGHGCAAGPEAPAGVRGAGSPLGSPRRAHHWAHHQRTCGLTTMGSPLSHHSLPLGSPLELTAGLFSKGYLRRLELHRLLQRRAQVGVVHHRAPATGAATEQPKASRRDGEGGGNSAIECHAVGGESEVEFYSGVYFPVSEIQGVWAGAQI